MTYLIPENLIDSINQINNRTQLFSIPYCTGSVIVIDVPQGWTEQEAFVTENNLQPYNPE